MKKFNGMVLVLVGMIGCGLYAMQVPDSPRTKKLIEAVIFVEDTRLGEKDKHVQLLIELAEVVKEKLDDIAVAKKRQIEVLQEDLQEIDRAIKS